MIDELRVARSPLAERFAFWRDEFVALEGWLAPGRAAQTCHRDLWADNLRRTTAGTPCVIDWDSAGPGSRLWDIAYAVHGFVPLSANRQWQRPDAGVRLRTFADA